jgi:DNA-binding XRE family transcriptional regulator
MPPVVEELEVRKKRAEDWKSFRKENLFTQRRLAETLGVSRRTIQQIEGAYITPHQDTLRLFAAFQKKYDTNKDISMFREEMKESANG